MKKLLLTLAAVTLSVLTTYGQARVNFNNVANGNLISINSDPGLAGAGQGAPGALLGSDYTIQMLWAAGTFANTAAFLAATPSSSTPLAFFGTTGDGGSGAGFFDNVTAVALGGAAGTYSFLAQAWYNPSGLTTYAAAAAAGVINVGQSALISFTATQPATPAVNTPFPSFTVQAIPEPATMALLGLGSAGLAFMRRRKQQ